MLSILRTNQILVTLILLPYIIILHLPVLIFNQEWEPSSPGILAQTIYSIFGDDSWAIRGVLILLIFAEAYLINRLVLKHRLAKEYNLFSGLFFAMIACSVPEFLFPAPAHFANLFLILAISELLKTYRKSNCAHNIFNTGLCISVASCLYFPSALFALLGLFGFNLMRAIKIKELFIVIAGLLVPYILIGAYMFWTNQWAYWLQEHFLASPAWFAMNFPAEVWSYMKIGWLLILSLIAFLSYGSYRRRMKMQQQKKLNVFYWVLILALIITFSQSEEAFEHLLLLAVPLGVFLALNFTNLRPQVAEILHLFLFLAILFVQYKDWLF